MTHVSNSDVIVLLLMAASVVIGPILLVAAVVLLAVPSLRQQPARRRLAFGLGGAAAVFLFIGSPIWSELAPELLTEFTAPLLLRARTRHPSRPTAYDGITFPPGSTVTLTSSMGDVVESATVPAPTTVLGVPLIGSFEMERFQGRRAIGNATLAAAAEVDGFPCAPGPFEHSDDRLSCILARDHDVIDHALASGTKIKIDPGLEGQAAWLAQGTLARPELLYGITWPAGTVIGSISQPPAAMAELPGPPDGRPDLCVPAGAVVSMPWADMHGPVMLEINGEELYIWQGCSSLVPDLPDGGFIQVGPDRWGNGTRKAGSSEWQWSDPVDPDPATP